MSRDFGAEYARRVEQGRTRGFTRAQARGHPEVNMPFVSGRSQAPAWDERLEEGVKRLRGGDTIAGAAGSIHVTEERLRRYLAGTGVAHREGGGRWRIGRDRRPRVVVLYSRRRAVEIIVAGYDEARQVGDYMNAVARLQERNDPSALGSFRGQGVRDTRGRVHRFETDPNELFRLMAAGPEPFEQVYKIVVI